MQLYIQQEVLVKKNDSNSIVWKFVWKMNGPGIDCCIKLLNINVKLQVEVDSRECPSLSHMWNKIIS